MQALISDITALVNAVFVNGGSENGTAWVSSIVTCITSNPLLYIGFILSIAGFGIGAIKRLSKLG